MTYPISITISQSPGAGYGLVPSDTLTPSATLTPSNGVVFDSELVQSTEFGVDMVQSTEYGITITQPGGS